MYILAEMRDLVSILATTYEANILANLRLNCGLFSITAAVHAACKTRVYGIQHPKELENYYVTCCSSNELCGFVMPICPQLYKIVEQITFRKFAGENRTRTANFEEVDKIMPYADHSTNICAPIYGCYL